MKTNYDILNINVCYIRTVQQYGIIVKDRSALASLVRAGDKAAREKLILSFFRYCSLQAYRFSQDYRERRVEYVDLAQTAMLTVLSGLDQALEKYDDPFPYIFLSIKRTLLDYCLFHSTMIHVPETRGETERARYQPHTVDSLEALLRETDIAERREQSNTCAALLRAVENLSARLRQVIELHYGIDGNSSMSLDEVNALIGGKNRGAASSYQNRAIKKLRETLSCA